MDIEITKRFFREMKQWSHYKINNTNHASGSWNRASERTLRAWNQPRTCWNLGAWTTMHQLIFSWPGLQHVGESSQQIWTCSNLLVAWPTCWRSTQHTCQTVPTCCGSNMLRQHVDRRFTVVFINLMFHLQ